MQAALKVDVTYEIAHIRDREAFRHQSGDLHSIEFDLLVPARSAARARSIRAERRDPGLTSALDADDYVYVDFVHLSPNGNRMVATRIVEIAEALVSSDDPTWAALE